MSPVVRPTKRCKRTTAEVSKSRSVKVSAPGVFITQLTRKAESAGGQLKELNTRHLRMSQYDHPTGQYEKKPLSQRTHRLGGTETRVQRDCYSAFLAKYAGEGEHNPSQLEQGWAAAEPLLRRAGLCVDQSATGIQKWSPTVAIPSERIARRRRFVRGLSRDAAGTQYLGRTTHVCL